MCARARVCVCGECVCVVHILSSCCECVMGMLSLRLCGLCCMYVCACLKCILLLCVNIV